MKRQFFFDFSYKRAIFTSDAQFEIHKTVIYNLVAKAEIHYIADPFLNKRCVKAPDTNIILTCLN